jgi:hypothetical protein
MQSARMIETPAMTRMTSAALFVLALATCDSSPLESVPSELAAGTWGGENVGVVVSDEVAHVHVGCTYGDFPAPVTLDEDGRFSVAGEYLLRAFPIAIGPTLPAQLAGVVRGGTLTLTVAVNDTIEKRLVVLGPATVAHGVEAEMGPCPICENLMSR